MADFLSLNLSKRTRGHSKKLLKKPAKLDIRKYSFTHRIVNTWNSLTEEIISAPSVNAFENRLDKFWSRQPIKYDFKAELDMNENLNLKDKDLDIEAPMPESSTEPK